MKSKIIKYIKRQKIQNNILDKKNKGKKAKCMHLFKMQGLFSECF